MMLIKETTAKHFLKQGPVIKAMGQAVMASLRSRSPRPASASTSLTPTLKVYDTVPSPDRELVRDFIAHLGGDPLPYLKHNILPPHLFPQWGVPLCTLALQNTPYSFIKVINAGCRLEIRKSLPIGRPLYLSSYVAGIEENEKRARIHQILNTGTEDCPEALVAHLFFTVPIKRPQSSSPSSPTTSAQEKGSHHQHHHHHPLTIPTQSQEIGRYRLDNWDGLRFAFLTGDINPIHWSSAYAKIMGHKGKILHGYSSMGRSLEGLYHFLGGPLLDEGERIPRIKDVYIRFTSPLPLPAEVNLFHQSRTFTSAPPDVPLGEGKGGEFFLGKEIGEKPYLTGHYLLQSSSPTSLNHT